MSRLLIIALCLAGSTALAQAGSDLPPPPLVPASPPPTPSAEPGVPPIAPATAAPNPYGNPGTPPPPSTAPGYPPTYQPSPTYVPGQRPGQSGYQYSPYGQPMNKQPPGPEIGLMVTESLFGMLTAAGVTILPYLLFSLTGILDGDPTLSAVLLMATVAIAPLSVAQTQTGIANGSNYYHIDSWIPLLTGLAGEGLVVLTYYAARGGTLAPPQTFNTPTGVPENQAPIYWLLIGSAAVVPILQMVAINLFKQPKFKAYAEDDNANHEKKALATLGLPKPMPVLTQTATGNPSVGLGISLLNGTW
jgi:hypothetical protein